MLQPQCRREVLPLLLRGASQDQTSDRSLLLCAPWRCGSLRSMSSSVPRRSRSWFAMRLLDKELLLGKRVNSALHLHCMLQPGHGRAASAICCCCLEEEESP